MFSLDYFKREDRFGLPFLDKLALYRHNLRFLLLNWNYQRLPEVQQRQASAQQILLLVVQRLKASRLIVVVELRPVLIRLVPVLVMMIPVLSIRHLNRG